VIIFLSQNSLGQKTLAEQRQASLPRATITY
jgi:hypothetical protein